MLDTEFPHIMDDIEPNKVTRMKEINRRTRPLFRKKETSMQISWCIAAIGNEVWAKDLFPNETNAKELLDNLIYKCCMVDTNHPIESWNTFLETSKQLVEKLNHLQIKKLHYKNSLGTDLEIEMPKGAIWESAASEFENHSIVNMPSYEIFSSPHYLKVNGIVYSALPLIYGGAKIDKFFVEFKDGKVVNFDADMGKEILKGIIEGGDNSCYLGEVALVNHNSPISNTNVVFGTTLFDENASCHLAFGDGFTECIEGGENMTKEELLKHGVNQSDAHVDFMIGTDDLDIEAETNKGKVKIFERGNFCI
jgi:aminopeptidase